MSKCLSKKLKNSNVVSISFSPETFKSLMDNLKTTFLKEDKKGISFIPLEREEDSLFFEGETEFDQFIETYRSMF